MSREKEIKTKDDFKELEEGDRVCILYKYETPTGVWIDLCEGSISEMGGSYIYVDPELFRHKCLTGGKMHDSALGLSPRRGYYFHRNRLDREKTPTTMYKIYSPFSSNNNKSMLQKLTTALKRALPTALQKQYRAGLRNGDLELTERGEQELLEILAEEKKDELTEVAEDIVEEHGDNN